jgi:hypothetical protein
MEYTILADARLSIDPGRFASAWNSDHRASKLAVAAAQDPEDRVYDGGLTALLAVLSAVAAGVAANLITEKVRDVLDRISDTNPTVFEVTVEDAKDGVRVVRVREKKG